MQLHKPMNPLEEKEFLKLQELAESMRKNSTREQYSRIRTEREKATFAMMMRMNPEALTAIRKEFFVRQDEIVLEEFIYIIQRHLNKTSDFDGEEQREFGMKMFDLFQDIDVNGDGNLEWQEFTSFVVEKANILNKRLKSTSIAHYYDNSEAMDASALYRHRHDISKFAKIPNLCQFAMVEDHKNAIYVFNSRAMKQVATIQTESAPVALEYIQERDLLVASSADMTLSTYSMSDPNHNRRYRQKSSWSTPGVQMALAYMPANQLLYSGGTNGNLYSWEVQNRSLVSTFVGHTDIVMALTVLKKLNNIASGSLDKTVNVWDSYTNARVLELQGHKKGVLDMAYSPEYRLLFSCGFEHDACVWSPFVNSLVYRFKGHHASLVGIEAVEDTPEVITADISGIFKLWDIRNYQCVQTFMANLTGSDTKDSSKLSCFFQTRLPPANTQQREDDSRIFAASKMLFCFDQARVVHDATTDFAMVQWVGWNPATSNFVTVSDRTAIVWDALIGTKTVTTNNVTHDDISACCFDDRKRKLIIGCVSGNIGIYNFTNGALMKSVQDHVEAAVVGLEYVEATRRFIAAYANGIMRVYDENSLEECNIVHTFDFYKNNKELEIIGISFCPTDNTIARVDACSGVATLWDLIACKCEFELRVCDNTECVVNVAYLNPYPLVATSDTKGNVCIWGSRGCKWSGKRIAGFTNQSTLTAIVERTVSSIHEEDTKPTRILADVANARHHSNINSNSVAELDILECIDEDDATVDSATRSQATFDTMQTENAQHTEGLFNGINSNSNNKFLGNNSSRFNVYDGSKNSDAENADLAKAVSYVDSIAKQWGPVMAAHCMCMDEKSFRLYTADDLGYIRCFSMENMMSDIGGEEMLEGTAYKLKNRCLKLPRTDKSAPPPIFLKHRNFMVGHKMQAMSYLGIDFVWTLQGHKDRVCFLHSISYGIISSGADRLVKMWSIEGELLGVLLQSVPVGIINRHWHLQIDAEKLIAGEEILLDKLLEDVKELASRDDLPDIDTADLTGIEVGSGAAEFSQSDLRQRIDQTSEILGIDFKSFEEELASKGSFLDVNGDDQDNSSVGNLSTLSGDTSLQRSLASSAASSAMTTKSLESALTELKSAGASVDYEFRAASLTHLQKRRRAAKMQQIAEKYAEKAGILIDTSKLSVYKTGLPETENGESHGPPLFETQPAPTPSTGSLAEGSSSAGISTKSTRSNTSTPAPSPLKTAGSMAVSPMPSCRSSRSGMTSPLVSKGSSLLATVSVPKGKQPPSGPRVAVMNTKCSQYSSFDALDKALDAMSSARDYVPSTEALQSESVKKEAQRIREWHTRLIEGHTKLPAKMLPTPVKSLNFEATATPDKDTSRNSLRLDSFVEEAQTVRTSRTGRRDSVKDDVSVGSR